MTLKLSETNIQDDAAASVAAAESDDDDNDDDCDDDSGGGGCHVCDKNGEGDHACVEHNEMYVDDYDNKYHVYINAKQRAGFAQHQLSEDVNDTSYITKFKLCTLCKDIL